MAWRSRLSYILDYKFWLSSRSRGDETQCCTAYLPILNICLLRITWHYNFTIEIYLIKGNNEFVEM